MREGLPKRKSENCPDCGKVHKGKLGLFSSLAKGAGLSMALIHAPLVLEKIGSEKFELNEAYQKTLTLARQDYEALKQRNDASLIREDGTKQSFEGFLAEKDIPSMDEIQALNRLIKEFERPVELNKGMTLLQRTIETSFGNREVFSAGSYRDRFHGGTHQVHIYPEEHYADNDPKKADEKKYLTRQDVELIVAELAHATQTEQGKGDQMTEDAKANTFLEDRHEAYETEGNMEHEAHSIIEPELDRRMLELRDSYRTQSVTLLKEASLQIGYKVPDGFFEGNINHNSFSNFLDAVEVAFNKKNASAQSIINTIYRLPGFEATFTWQDEGKRPILENIKASPEFYGSFQTFLQPYAGPTETAHKYVGRILASESVKNVRAMQRQETDRMLAQQMPSNNKKAEAVQENRAEQEDLRRQSGQLRKALADAVNLTGSKKFTKNQYEKMIRHMDKYRSGSRSSSEAVNNGLRTLIEIDAYLEQQARLRKLSVEDRYMQFKELYDKSSTG